jgi:hypothetical protein
MNLLTSLWQPAPKDALTGRAPQRFFRRQVTVFNGVSIPFFIPLASDGLGLNLARENILQLVGVSFNCLAGGGQNVVSVVLQVSDEGGTPLWNPYIEYTVGAPLNFGRTFAFAPDTLVMGSERLTMTTAFSSGISANNSTMDIWGVILPRGNWQYA